MELSYSWCVRWTENPEEVVRFHWAPQVAYSSGLRARSAKPWIRGFESHRDLDIGYVVSKGRDAEESRFRHENTTRARLQVRVLSYPQIIALDR